MSDLDTRSMPLRSFLWFVVLIFIFTGLMSFIFVIFKSLTSGVEDEGRGNPVADHRMLKVDVSVIAPGQLYKTAALHKEIWVYHRTAEDIARLKATGQALRAVNENFFVFFPYETRRNCQVNLDTFKQVFFDPCHGQAYDMAGYPVEAAAASQLKPLPVPAHHYRNDGMLLIDSTSNLK